MEVFVPIIPLALLPANSDKLGAAFGVIELLFISLQMLIAFLIGFVRDHAHTAAAGYNSALHLMVGSFVVVLMLSLPVGSPVKSLNKLKFYVKRITFYININ